MTMTINDIVKNPHLKTSVIAGADGINNTVTWAHSCELKDPTPWLTGGELIMTNGLAIPPDEKGQIEYLLLLVHAGASGIAISHGLHAPTLTDGLLLTANKNGFPILLTDYEVPWIFFSQTIAASNSNQEYTQVTQTLRIYDIVRKFIGNTPPAIFIEELEEIIKSNLYVMDTNSKRLILSDDEENIFHHFEEIISYNMPSSIQRTIQDDYTIIKVPIVSTRPALLLVISESINTPNNLILRHIATIMGLILEKDTVIYERQRRVGAELMLQMIEDEITEEIAATLLAEHNLANESLYIIACSIPEALRKEAWLHYILYDQNIPHLLVYQENALLILTPMVSEVIDILHNEVPRQVYLGISEVIDQFSRAPDAYQEALWALRSAKMNNNDTVYYKSKELPISPFLPQNRLEAQQIVNNILGELLQYDKSRDTQLIETLYVYLRENRSWKITANKLHIHKQTLVYRIKRIEEISGVSLDNISDISRLWLALQTANMLGVLPDIN